jgi:hypothetical protein
MPLLVALAGSLGVVLAARFAQPKARNGGISLVSELIVERRLVAHLERLLSEAEQELAECRRKHQLHFVDLGQE